MLFNICSFFIKTSLLNRKLSLLNLETNSTNVKKTIDEIKKLIIIYNVYNLLLSFYLFIKDLFILLIITTQLKLFEKTYITE